jgi:PAS domain S-box-containing protein
MIPKAMKSGSVSGDITLVKTNGDLMQVSQVLVCKKNKNGRVDFFASISRDISDVKEKEEEIKLQQTYLYSIIDANPNLIFVKDEESRYKLINKKFAKASGTTIKNIIGKSDSDLPNAFGNSERYLLEDKSIIESGKPTISEEKYLDKKTNEERWLQTVKIPLKTPKGTTEILGVSTDITDIKKIEERLTKQLHYSELIAKISTDFFNISYKEIDEVMIYTLETICNNTSMNRSVIAEIDSNGKFSYRHVFSSDAKDPLNKGKYALINYTEDDFLWIQNEINTKGFAFSSESSTLSDDSNEKQLLKKIGIKSFFIVPLQLKNKRLGYLILSSRDIANLPEADLTFIKTLTHILANAIERANTEKLIEYRLSFEEIITAISSKFINIQAEQIDAEITEALGIVGDFFKTDQGYVFHYNKKDKTLNLTHSWFEDGRSPDLGDYWGLPYDAFPWAFETIQNNNFISIPTLNHLPEEAAMLKEVMAAGGLKSMFGVPIFFHKEFVGAYIFASFTKERFWMDEAEPLLKILGQVFASALERKRNDEQLRESEKLYRTIASNIPKVGVVVFDKDLRIKVVEGRNFSDYKIRTDMMEGKTFEELKDLPYMPYDYNEYDEYNAHYKRVLQGEEVTIEKNYLQFFYKIHICPVKNSKGEVIYGLLIAFDISDFKAIENKLQQQAFELQRSNEDLEQFAYAASHDLQEPLRMVSSYVHLIERKIGQHLSSDVKEFMFYAIDGVKRMQELINDILEYSRVERKGKDFSKIELNTVMRAVTFNLQKNIADNNVELIYPELPAVKADYSQITSLLQNLVDNAIKFKSNKKPVIEIGYTEQKSKYTFYVKDNGVGIEKKYYDRIFVIFQRLNNRTEYPGTGIGLSICKKIVERHGGKIWVESIVNEGTTFYFELKK